MNLLRLVIWLLLYALFLVRTVLFRTYLFVMFLSKDGAAWLLFLLSGTLVLLSWPLTGALLEEWFVPIQAEIDGFARVLQRETGSEVLSGLLSQWALEITLAISGLITVRLLKAVSGVLRTILAAFPMPARPLPPQRVWLPPAHRIRAVACRLSVPRLPLRWWSGDQAELLDYLKPELRAMIGELPPSPDLSSRDSAPAPEQPPLRSPAVQPAE